MSTHAVAKKKGKAPPPPAPAAATQCQCTCPGHPQDKGSAPATGAKTGDTGATTSTDTGESATPGQGAPAAGAPPQGPGLDKETLKRIAKEKLSQLKDLLRGMLDGIQRSLGIDPKADVVSKALQVFDNFQKQGKAFFRQVLNTAIDAVNRAIPAIKAFIADVVSKVKEIPEIQAVANACGVVPDRFGKVLRECKNGKLDPKDIRDLKKIKDCAKELMNLVKVGQGCVTAAMGLLPKVEELIQRKR